MCEYDSKLLKLVVDGTPKAIFGLIVVSSIFIWTYVDYIPLEYLLLWSFVQVVFIASRYVNAKTISKYIEKKDTRKIKIHTKVFSIIVVISAILWSAGILLGAFFAPTPYEFVGLAMIMGIITAAVLSLTPIFNVFLAYFFIMISAQIAIMVYYGTHAHFAIIIFLLIYMPLIVLLSKSIYNNHLRSITDNNTLESHIAELRELSITDSLTKVYNRRHFFEAAQTLIYIAKRDESDISFLMIDLDYFKNVNDTYGHQIGDYILIKLAKEIQEITRSSDVFARIGGEEFALLLHATSREAAKIIAEKIRTTIEMIDFSKNYISMNVTVSVGVSTLSESITTLEELYQEADKKLYIAKELGRNRVQ